MKQLSLLLLASILAFSSCKKDEDPVVGETITISNDIVEDMIWLTGNVYIIDGTIRVRNADITIQKGVTVKFTEGAHLDVAYWDNEYSTITAHGTADEPILFTSNNPSPQVGDWVGVYFYKGANNCEFSYCTFQYGGSDQYRGMISIEEASVSFEDCTFRKSEGKAIILFQDAFFSSFTRNTMKENGDHHISIYPNFVHTIGINNTYSSELGILVSNDGDLDQKGSYTWLKQAAPYYIEGNIRIGAIGEGVNFTIEAGTTLKFMNNALFDIAYWADKYATINFVGTAEEPIIFTSANPSPVKGDWNGLFFYNGISNSTISHCQIMYAGQDNYKGAIDLTGCGSPLNLNNTSFSHIKSHAITVDDQSSVDYSNNVTFSDIDGENYHIK